MRKLSKGRMLALAVGAALATSGASTAQAAFQYMLENSTGASSQTLSASDLNKPIRLDLWAVMTDPQSKWNGDSPSTDAFSIKSSNDAAGAGLTGGGVIGAAISNGFSTTDGQSQNGAALANATTGLTDWGGSGSTPTLGYMRYIATHKSAKAGVASWLLSEYDPTNRNGDPNTTNKYFDSALTPDPTDPDGINGPAWSGSVWTKGITSKPQAGIGSPPPLNAAVAPGSPALTQFAWRVATITVTPTALGPNGGKTTFMPVSALFSGNDAAYNLAYYFQADLSSGSTASVTTGQDAPVGFTFISNNAVVTNTWTAPKPTGTGPTAHAQFGNAAAGNMVSGVLTAQDDGQNGALGTKVTVTGATPNTFAFRQPAADEVPQNPAGAPLSKTQPPAYGLISDVVDINGIADGTPYLLTMTFSAAQALTQLPGEVPVGTIAQMDSHNYIRITTLDPTDHWVNADGGDSMKVAGAVPTSLTGLNVGNWGVDPGTDTAWVVVNHNSQFAVVPEPAALGLLGLASLGLLARKRRRA